ncbi:hypothetical protein F4809DRAFT_600048 [Biscogniauxia mediterranea]|nr:hypothetical protein F4809DRAFT_600048 [Biscogniauxia mediterranea]
MAWSGHWGLAWLWTGRERRWCFLVFMVVMVMMVMVVVKVMMVMMVMVVVDVVVVEFSFLVLWYRRELVQELGISRVGLSRFLAIVVLLVLRVGPVQVFPPLDRLLALVAAAAAAAIISGYCVLLVGYEFGTGIAVCKNRGRARARDTSSRISAWYRLRAGNTIALRGGGSRIGDRFRHV